VSIELVNGSIPADFYNINTGWNQFTFGEGTATKNTLTLTPGQYTPQDLCTELQTQLNSFPGKLNTYTVTYNTVTMMMNISAVGSAEYTFYFLTSTFKDTIDAESGALVSINCPGRIFGFEWQDYTSVGLVLKPQNRMDTDMFLKKAYLYINADNSIEFNRVEMGAGRKDCFHVIYMDEVVNGYYTLNKDMHTPIFYSSPAPIARVNTLNISIRDEFYRLIDLGWKDYTLLFEITFLE
jgi:hypothetical protein